MYGGRKSQSYLFNLIISSELQKIWAIFRATFKSPLVYRHRFELHARWHNTSWPLTFPNMTSYLVLHCPRGCRQATPPPALLSVICQITLPASVSRLPGTLLKKKKEDMIVRKVRAQKSQKHLDVPAHVLFCVWSRYSWLGFQPFSSN